MHVVHMIDNENGTKHANCRQRTMRLIWSGAQVVLVVESGNRTGGEWSPNHEESEWSLTSSLM